MAASKNKKTVYDLHWPPYMEPLAIEFAMIRKGGTVTLKDGKIAGNGLFWHWQRALSLLDPGLVWHKWNRLQSECYTKYRTVVVMGPASSGKTRTAAGDCLLDYYLYPSCTSIVICSTTRERLEDRIWGELKMLHRKAKELYPWLPGHLIEGRLRLVTDERSQAVDGRDFRNGIIGVACFPSGTLVDTPIGKIPIQNVKIGDPVFNAFGIGTVKETKSRIAKRLVRISLSDGRFVDCTPEHPFFTQRGWIKAIDLTTSEMVFSHYETLSILRRTVRKRLSKSKVLFDRMSPSLSIHTMCVLQKTISTLEESGENQRKILLQSLLWKMGRRAFRMQTNCSEIMQALRKTNDGSALQPRFLFDRMQKPTNNDAVSSMWESLRFNQGVPEEKTLSFLQQILQAESNRSSVRQEACQTDTGRNGRLEVVYEFNRPLPCQDWIETVKRKPSLVSTRFGFPSDHVGGRSGRRDSSSTGENRKGSQTEQNFGGTWVDGVTFLERGGDPRFEESSEGYRVYNLEIDGHPSYSVNGVIVHNCKRGDNYIGIADFAGIKNKRVRLLGDEISFLPKAFVDAISNLDKNEDFKAIGLGNPKDTTDALGVLAEPSSELGGWESGVDQTPKTKTWPIRRTDGICVQLVGSDSPNLDGRLGIPLITQEQIDRDVAFYGKDSMQFTMMNEGRMPRGQGSHRVLTRQMCVKFGAMEEPIWRDSRIKKIAWMDAGYGGDRCTFGEIQFGMLAESRVFDVATTPLANNERIESHRKQILNFVDTMVVPVSSDKGAELPEDQIVNFVVAQLSRRGIPLEDFFYDPGLRTKLTVAFARITGKTGNPIDCGGPASERQVAQGIDMTCDKYYSKFVTELWYSVRLAVEAGQVRGMTEEMVAEFCMREWKKVSGNRIEVEPKEDMKKKMGRSPDLADGASIGVEGCRQRGFVIVKIGSEVLRSKPQIDGWKREARETEYKLWHSGDLEYAEAS